jgi:hypothetical protein
MSAHHIRLLPQGALLALFWLSLFAPTMQAAETKTIRLSPGFATLIKLDQVIGTIIIGSPDVVDGTLQGDKAVLLTAKRITGSAATNVMVLDPQGTEIFNATIAVGSQGSGKVEVHSMGRAGEYWAYRCSPICERVEDKLETIQRGSISEAPAAVPAPSPAAPETAPAQTAPR